MRGNTYPNKTPNSKKSTDTFIATWRGRSTPVETTFQQSSKSQSIKIKDKDDISRLLLDKMP